MTWHHMCLQICKNAQTFTHKKRNEKKKKKIDLNLVKDNMGYQCVQIELVKIPCREEIFQGKERAIFFSITHCESPMKKKGK